MDQYREANRQLWEEWAAIHPGTDFYRVEEFKRGWDPLKPFEVEEMGDVAGRALLHLQCHFGRDTLAWVRRGARVTGADFSETAIRTARGLAAELGMEARFEQSELYDLPSRLEGRFDIVYTSFGAIYWLPDIDGWAEVVDHFLAPGGRFYIAEFDPITHVFDDSEGATEPRVRYPYFHRTEPIAWPVEGSYADRQAAVESTVEYGWNHSLADVVSAIAARGLRIEFLHELPYTQVQWAPFLEKREDGSWWLPGPGELPMVFTMMATKPAHDMDDLSAAVAEATRVMAPQGHLCVAVVHPINSAGSFESEEPDACFTIGGSYMDAWTTPRASSATACG